MSISLRDQTTLHLDDSKAKGGLVQAIGATILFHSDVHRIGEIAPLMDLGSNTVSKLCRVEPTFHQPDFTTTDALLSPMLSRKPIELQGTPDSGLRIIKRPGGSQVIADGQLLEGERLFSLQDLSRGIVLELAKSVVLLVHLMDATPAKEREPQNFIGDSIQIRQLRLAIKRVADLDVPVLLHGETGVGKELVALSIHESSKRAGKPYVCVNMAAIPASLAASELFGHTQGAFTGATGNRKGYFVEANGGTLFLDELGDTPVEVQPLLLRAIENKIVQPVGGKIGQIDVRLIAATDSNLEQAIEKGVFRRPLLERIAGYTIQIPPLRERRDDIGRLFIHFLQRELCQMGEADRLKELSPGKSWVPASLVANLARYDWPGNVRQLQNIVRQLTISNRDTEKFTIDPVLEKLLDRSGVANEKAQPGQVMIKTRRSRPADYSEEEILDALERNRYNYVATAADLDVSRSWLDQRLDLISGIRKAKDIGAEEIEQCAKACNNDLEQMANSLRVSPRGLKLQMTRLGLT